MNKSEKDMRALQEANDLLSSNQTLDEDFVILGEQLVALETIDQPKRMSTWMGEGTDLKLAINRDAFIEKAKEFLKKFGEAIVKEVCAWWNNNQLADRSALIAALGPIIAAAVPPPFGLFAGIVTVIAVILIRAGMSTVCQTQISRTLYPWMM